jgi:hypothetical protein
MRPPGPLAPRGEGEAEEPVEVGLLWGYFAPTDPVRRRGFGGSRVSSRRFSAFPTGGPRF